MVFSLYSLPDDLDLSPEEDAELEQARTDIPLDGEEASDDTNDNDEEKPDTNA